MQLIEISVQQEIKKIFNFVQTLINLIVIRTLEFNIQKLRSCVAFCENYIIAKINLNSIKPYPVIKLTIISMQQRKSRKFLQTVQ